MLENPKHKVKLSNGRELVIEGPWSDLSGLRPEQITTYCFSLEEFELKVDAPYYGNRCEGCFAEGDSDEQCNFWEEHINLADKLNNGDFDIYTVQHGLIIQVKDATGQFVTLLQEQYTRYCPDAGDDDCYDRLLDILDQEIGSADGISYLGYTIRWAAITSGSHLDSGFIVSGKRVLNQRFFSLQDAVNAIEKAYIDEKQGVPFPSDCGLNKLIQYQFTHEEVEILERLYNKFSKGNKRQSDDLDFLGQVVDILKQLKGE